MPRDMQRTERDGLVLWVDARLEPAPGATSVVVALRRLFGLIPYLDIKAREHLRR
ncbi:hypothetical protein Deval_0383 [Nitratidesulfovibrio vulgaris RCH1]|jgi:hypothetical protein|nr:hypothetical protein Deval_0383 [Nitratidesulfovibrio vulgaris RCH1]